MWWRVGWWSSLPIMRRRLIPGWMSCEGTPLNTWAMNKDCRCSVEPFRRSNIDRDHLDFDWYRIWYCVFSEYETAVLWRHPQRSCLQDCQFHGSRWLKGGIVSRPKSVCRFSFESHHVDPLALLGGDPLVVLSLVILFKYWECWFVLVDSNLAVRPCVSTGNSRLQAIVDGSLQQKVVQQLIFVWDLVSSNFDWLKKNRTCYVGFSKHILGTHVCNDFIALCMGVCSF